jgi:DNA invertase Pin-like site-specific DNA recombinase
MVYGYARCSTGEDRQDIDRQKRELEMRGATQIFSEYASGAKSNRLEFDSVMNQIVEGDTLIVTEVSRLSRSLHELCHVVELAKSNKIKLICGSLVLDFISSEPCQMTLTMFYVMGIFGQYERGVTVERIRSGIANARANGKTVGRPKKTQNDVPQEVKDLLPKYKRGEIGKAEYAKKAGITRPTLYKYLQILGVEEKPTRKRMGKRDVSPEIKKLYLKYKSGELSMLRIAKLTGLHRSTIKRHFNLLDGESATGSTPFANAEKP